MILNQNELDKITRYVTSMYAVSLLASFMRGNHSRGGLDKCLVSVSTQSNFGQPEHTHTHTHTHR